MIDLRWSFRGEQGKAAAQWKTRLRAEDGDCPGAGAVVFGFSLFQDETQQFLVFLHFEISRPFRRNLF